MTSVNVTTTKNTVTVSEGDTRIVTIKTQGPQGPSLPDGDKGDVTVSSNGTAISINNSAVTSAKIADGAIVDADINASAAIALTKLATGALPTAITVTSANISDLSIVDADISASAAISLSKLATGALPTAITVTSANISDLSIVNADINASAAIAGTKISPDFGSQNIVTTGTAATGALGVTGNLTVSGTVDGVDVATRDALFGGLTSSSGVLSNGVTATTQSASDNSTKVATTAYTDTAISNLINGAPAALDTLNELAAALNDDAAFSTTVTNSIATKMPLAGGQFTGNVTFSGTQTVDGRDLSVDGAKLDGIESGATADQTKSDIDALGIAASTATTLATARTIAGVSFDGSADISLNNNAITNGAGYITATLTNEQVQDIVGGMLTGNTETGITVTYQDGDGTIDFAVNQDTTGNAATATTLETARTIAGTSFDGSANIDISYTNLTNKLSVGDGGLTQNNFTDALKTKLDGVETGATADQTASEIVALIADQTIAPSTIDMEDNEKIKLGTGDDLEIYHDPSSGSGLNYIKAVSGYMMIQQQGNGSSITVAATNVYLKNHNNNETFLYGVNNGSVDLYYDNSKKLETTSTGVKITGTGTNTVEINGTGGHELYSYHDSGGVGWATGASTNYGELLYLNESGSKIHLYAGGVERLKVDSSGASVTGNIAVSGTVDGVDIATRDTLFGGLTSSSGVLTNGVTATTQSASDNSTKVATTAYADTAISNLVNSAPSTLDTLNELAAALGDDPNFATTVTNSIATKLPLAGGQITGNITCSGSQTFDGRDLSVDGTKLDGIESNATADQTASEIVSLLSDQNITTTGTLASGDLTLTDVSPSISFTDSNNNPDFSIYANGGILNFHDDTNSTVRMRINADGHVDVIGHLDVGAGLDVTGNITVSGTVDGRDIATDGTKLDGIESNATADQTASEIVALVADQTIAPSEIDMEDNEKILLGTGDDLEIYHSSDISRIRNTNDSGTLKIQATSNGENAINIVPNGTTELYFDGTKKFETTSSGATITGTLIADGLTLYDNEKLLIGSNTDIEVFHDGTNSIFQSDTGDLQINSGNSAGNVEINVNNNVAGNTRETSAKFIKNGAVELYYDNSKKLHTVADGIYVTGNIYSNKTGTAAAISLTDNGRLAFGSGADLQIYHDGGHSYIHQDGTGSLYILADTFRLNNEANTENIIAGNANGAAELYYDNSKKLETTSAGATLTGALTTTGNINVPTANSVVTGSVVTTNATALTAVDNGTAYFGTGLDLRISHTGTNSYITNTTGTLFTLSNIFEVKGSDGNETHLKTTNDGAVELYYDNSRKFRTYSSGVKIASDSSSGRLVFEDTDGNFCWQLTGFDAVSSGSGGRGAFQDANGAIVLDMRASGGNIFSYNTIKLNGGGSVDNLKLILGASDDLQIYHDGSHSYIDNNTGSLRVRDAGGAEKFRVSGTGTQFNDDITLSNDNDKINIGAGNDLQIYHDGTASRIYNTTGNLSFRSSSYYFNNSAGTENCLDIVQNGAVSLYYNGSKKFETTANGATVTGELRATAFKMNTADSQTIYLGAGNDLRIFHDGTDSYLRNETGELRVQADDFRVRNNANNQTQLYCNAGGQVELYYDNSKKFETTTNGIAVTDRIETTNGVWIGSNQKYRLYDNSGVSRFDTYAYNIEFVNKGTDGSISPYLARMIPAGAVELYHNGSKKFETDTSGVVISGRVHASGANNIGYSVADNVKSTFGNGADLQIYHDGSHSYALNTTGNLFLGSNNSVDIGDGDFTEYAARFKHDDAVELYYDNSKKFETTSTGATVTGSLGIGTTSPSKKLEVNTGTASDGIKVLSDEISATLGVNNTGDNYARTATLSVSRADSGSLPFLLLAGQGGIQFASDINNERMRIASDGNVGIGKSSSSLDVDGSIFIGSGQGMNMVKSGSGGKIITLNRRTNVGLSIEFYRGSSVGSISHNNTSTAYNTTSDYRLKENVVSLSDAITRLKTLKPYRFNFIADKDVTVDGFIAHEVTAVPEAIQGEKDAVVTQAMVDNNEYEEERLGEIIPQGIDQSKLVPLLVAAVQELIGRVEKLEGA